MNLTFADAELAALCNSERRLAQRWSAAVGRAVARRLLELAAADATTVGRLPGARVSVDKAGETVVVFGDEIVVRGVMSNSANGRHDRRDNDDQMMITSLDVHGSDRR